MKEVSTSTHYVGMVTTKYASFEIWDKFHHDPKYCEHKLGFLCKDGKMNCIACKKPRI